LATLHPQLANDCLLLGKFTLCHLLLMRDANYPWCILVPDRDGIAEIHQLCEVDQQQLLCESSQLSLAMEAAFSPDKLNIAALGNVVPQLHIHHIARYRTDAAWPAPVWGRVAVKPYKEDDLAAVVQSLLTELTEGFTVKQQVKKTATRGRR
jgi:diadenosine tetraphosphate (Ap4A) HIT family hydrolase